jgi:hypothetical protein
MKDLRNAISKILFYGMVGILMVWTASLTLSFVGSVLPGQPIAPYFSLVVFDAGMLIWLYVFLTLASGLPQRSISLLTCLFDMVGVGIMSASELFLGGQNYAQAPAGLGTLALWVIGLWTFMNIVATIAFHICDPETLHQIAVKSAQDKIVAASLEKMGHRMEEIGHEVSGRLAHSMTANAIMSLTGQAPPPPSNNVQMAMMTDSMPQPLEGRRPCMGTTGSGVSCKRLARPGMSTCRQHSSQEIQ